ncbi:poly(glycerophosphate chain) D-alanine transfer protein DltD [Liquorilactobacillus sucicola DSM 21376 = JCM 15457]|uniref:Protein DltD n=1 Tax=Liquorilactobacillus sucicola DSM 21376 = JCM 15457 TaxID=1423806 RepID=A0A023CWM9_9LACO|nr:D-alanyl-lipoteichoic acid biosynthesis protein DltD [Liquorilactobacillus sucicola]KRN06073.1 protein dltD precursor [Liquorilactobacillus sucicola DSM 21376 = JCM 15457]GAJ26001.1 poly(glycerophosphate chain) D-alanine transfer protein DltD [Liquorilactobacillus sucicola DSM 21376 = JCM 15457]
MNVFKKLFQIFGPIALAALILFVFLISPFGVKKISQTTIQKAALSQSPNIFKGSAVKEAAMSQNYVPFFGSSELSRMDALHPSVLAQKYQRNYRPFLLGSPGTQSLTHYWGMQGISKQLTNKKAVFIISPQWFVKKGIDPNAFSFYYSNLQTVEWLRHARDTRMDRYAASRLLNMPSARSSETLERCILRVAAGQKLTSNEKTYLDLKYNMLKHEDQMFSMLMLKDRRSLIEEGEKQLPDEYNVAKLSQVAENLGHKNTTNNRFNVDNNFWNKRLKKNYQKLRNEQSNFSYLKSVEYSDFQLVLNQFAKQHTDVLFIIPPINQKWADYTGLSMNMIHQFNHKIKHQLNSQGFDNVVDLSDDGASPYFMQDTIHLGWKGWLKVDQHVNPFLSQKQRTPVYKINNYFYTKSWQQRENIN